MAFLSAGSSFFSVPIASEFGCVRAICGIGDWGWRHDISILDWSYVWEKDVFFLLNIWWLSGKCIRVLSPTLLARPVAGKSCSRGVHVYEWSGYKVSLSSYKKILVKKVSLSCPFSFFWMKFITHLYTIYCFIHAVFEHFTSGFLWILVSSMAHWISFLPEFTSWENHFRIPELTLNI